MKIVVCVKQVATLGDEVEFTSDERDVDPDFLEFAINEWDTYATEEAIRIKEAAGDGEVVVVTVGDEDAEDAMRRALAMGADRGVRIEGEDIPLGDPITTARALAGVVRRESPDLVLLRRAVFGRRPGRDRRRPRRAARAPARRGRARRSTSRVARQRWSASSRAA